MNLDEAEPQSRSRKARKNATVIPDGIDGDDGDSDFIFQDDDDDDDDFIVSDDDSDRPKKRKGKGKAKAKPKSKAASKSTSGARSPASSGYNPKVMLISLKAGALGLNLTVANNVYLYVL